MKLTQHNKKRPKKIWINGARVDCTVEEMNRRTKEILLRINKND